MLNRVLTGIDAAIRGAAELMLWLAGAFVIGLFLIGTADVFGTQLLGVAVPSGIELQEALMGMMIFGALAPIQRRRAHIVVDVVSQYFGPDLKRLSELFGLAIGTLVFAVLAWQQWLLAARSLAIWELSPGFVAFPLWAVKCFAFAAAVVAALEFARQTVRRVIWWRREDPQFRAQAEASSD